MKKATGRPETFGNCESEEEMLQKVKEFRQHGLFDLQISHRLGVSKTKIRNLRKKYKIS